MQKLTQLAKISKHSAYFIQQTRCQHELTILEHNANLEEFPNKVELERIRMLNFLCNKESLIIGNGEKYDSQSDMED